MTEENQDIITLEDEEGTEHQFSVLDIIEVEQKEYAILLPVEEDEEDDEAIILRIDTDDSGNEVLHSIEEDDEWEKVAAAWESKISEEDA
ncbi:uncharacterized protein YrzB (UPF0473 family) [Desulfitispora alkaliphila]|uniref:DUF1292 domain-containing protein n=1 Tax=Desulfitispora alkaliphila TaxID=622674 RepID=UPI003D1D91C2